MAAAGWQRRITSIAFHDTLPLLLVGTCAPSNEVLELVLDGGAPARGLSMPAPFTASAPVTHVAYWGRAYTAGAAGEQHGVSGGGAAACSSPRRVRHRVALVVQADKSLLVVDLATRGVLYRHEPRNAHLMKLGRILRIGLAAPHLYFAAEDIARTRTAATPTCSATLFAVSLERNNVADMAQLDAGAAAPVEHIATHAAAPLLAVGHAVDHSISIVRVYTHYGAQPAAYNVTSFPASAADGAHVLGVAFLPTDVTATTIEPPSNTKRKQRATRGALVLVKGALLAVAKARKVQVLDVSVPGAPVALFYLRAPADRLFAGCFAQPQDATLLWIADTEGVVVPHALNFPATAASQVLAAAPTAARFGEVCFPVELLSEPLRGVNSARRALAAGRDAHVVLLATTLHARRAEARVDVAPHSHFSFVFHPTLPLCAIHGRTITLVKRLSRPLLLPFCGLPRSAPIAPLHRAVSSRLRAASRGADGVRLPPWVAVCDTDTLDPCAIRLTVVDPLGGCIEAAPLSTKLQDAAPRSSWPTAEALQQQACDLTRPQLARTVGALLTTQPLSLRQCWLLNISTGYVTPVNGPDSALQDRGRSEGDVWALVVWFVCQEEPECASVVGAQTQRVSIVVFSPSAPEPLREPHHLAFDCTAVAVDETSMTVYWIDQLSATLDEPVALSVLPLLGDTPATADAAYLAALDASRIVIPLTAVLQRMWDEALRSAAWAAKTPNFSSIPLSLFSSDSEEPRVVVAGAGVVGEIELTAQAPSTTRRGLGAAGATALPPPPGCDTRTAAMTETIVGVTFNDAAAATAVSTSFCRVVVLFGARGLHAELCLATPILDIAWCGELLVIHAEDGTLTTFNPFAQCAVLEGRPCVSAETLLVLPPELLLVGVLHDRVVLADPGTLHQKHAQQRSLLRQVAKVRGLQSRTLSKLQSASATSGKGAEAQRELVREQQALLDATMKLQLRTTEADCRRSRLFEGAAVITHAATNLLGQRLHARIAQHVVDGEAADAQQTSRDLQQLLLSHDVAGGCTTGVLMLLKGVGWGNAADAIAAQHVASFRGSSSLLFAAGAFETHAALRAVAARDGGKWPTSSLDAALLAARGRAAGAALTAELSELGWPPERGAEAIPVSAAAEILSNFAPSNVPAALHDGLRTGAVCPAECARLLLHAGGNAGEVAEYAEKYGGSSRPLSATLHGGRLHVDPRPIVRIAAAKEGASRPGATSRLPQLPPPSNEELAAALCGVSPHGVLSAISGRWVAATAGHWLHSTRQRAANCHTAGSSGPDDCLETVSAGNAADDDGSAALESLRGASRRPASSLSGDVAAPPASRPLHIASVADDSSSAHSVGAGSNGSGGAKPASSHTADYAREQEKLREAYLQAYKGLGGPAAAGGRGDHSDGWSTSSEDEDTQRGRGAAGGGGLRLGVVRFRAPADAATQGAPTKKVLQAAPAPPAGPLKLSLGGPSSSAPARRRVGGAAAQASSVGELLRRAGAAVDSLAFADALTAFLEALPMLIADPAEVAEQSRILQLVNYVVCCRIVLSVAVHPNDDAAEDGAPPVLPPFSPEPAMRLMHLLQLRLAPRHLTSLCTQLVIPFLVRGACTKAAFTALEMVKAADASMVQRNDDARLDAFIRSGVATALRSGGATADEALDDSLCAATVSWCISCGPSLRLLGDEELERALACKYCDAVFDATDFVPVCAAADAAREGQLSSGSTCPSCGCGKLESRS